MGRLERWTGRISLQRAVFNIVALGVVMTTLVVGVVWWAEEHRRDQALHSTSERLHDLVQEQLDHELALIHQLADWASYQSFDGDRSAAWHSQGVTLVGRDAVKAGVLPGLMGLSASHAQRLSNCLGQMPVSQRTLLCRTFGDAGQADVWFAIDRVRQPGEGWVIKPLQGLDQHWTLDDGVYWRLQARIEAERGVGEARWQDHTQAGDPVVHADVKLGTGSLPLRIESVPLSRNWQDQLTAYTSLGIAAGAGLLFMLGGLHVYLLLISTRRRAREMAKEMSASLELAQSRSQAVMDTAPDAIITTDNNGIVQWCNQATRSVFGRDLDQLQGVHVAQILPQFDGVDMAEWFGLYGFSNRVIGHECMGRRNDGPEFPVAVSASRAEVGGQTIQALFVRDLTDAKWAEQELLLRERALASSADGVVITSMTLPNQPMIYVNHAFETITGYESHEVLGLNCRMLQANDREQAGVVQLREAISQGRACQVVLRNYRKDGSLYYVDLAIAPVLSPEGELTHYVGVQTDITDRMAAEQVLALRTERLNAVFELSPDGFVVLDKRGEVSIVNPAFERMTGICGADLVGRSLGAFEETLLAHCAVSDVAERSVAAAIDGGSADGAQRRLLHLHAPQSRTLLQRVRHGGGDNETVMYFRDITHELEVDRMKSEFLAMAAHELRTPMVSIFGFTELLLRRSFSDERRQDMLGTIHKQAGILINLINELLDLARIEARRGKDFNRKLQAVGPVLEQALGGLQVPMGRAQVKLDLEQPDALAWADTDKLAQAVLNVLSNAYKYSPQGGEVALHQRVDVARQVVIIEVEDQGMGMSPEHAARVFERFFRADPSGNIPGTGLGMSLVKEIMDLHMGEVSLRSTLGEGTVVTLCVPAQVTQDARPALGPPASAGTSGTDSPLAKESTG